MHQRKRLCAKLHICSDLIQQKLHPVSNEPGLPLADPPSSLSFYENKEETVTSLKCRCNMIRWKSWLWSVSFTFCRWLWPLLTSPRPAAGYPPPHRHCPKRGTPKTWNSKFAQSAESFFNMKAVCSVPSPQWRLLHPAPLLHLPFLHRRLLPPHLPRHL